MKMHRLVDKMTNVVMNYSDVESKVREATNDETWGPHGSLMQEIAKYTFTYEHYPEVMSMLWKRMFESKKNWRRTYKSLLLLNYLIRNGSDRVVTSSREHLYDMKALEDYSCRDDSGKDQGVNVRQKAKEIQNFLQDEERLREARKLSKQNRDKFVGYSSDDVHGRYSDRYDSEPRMRSAYDHHDKPVGHYDEDRRGPICSDDTYRDEENGEVHVASDDVHERSKTKEHSPTPDKFEQKSHQSPHLSRSKKPAHPSKLVDLGAAATFAAQDEKQKTAQAQQQSGGDIFGGFSSTQVASTQQGGGFANFDTVFSTSGGEQLTTGSPGFGEFAAFQSTGASLPPPVAATLMQPVQAQQSQPFEDFGSFSGSSTANASDMPLLMPQQLLSSTTASSQQNRSTTQPTSTSSTKPADSSKSTLWSSPGVDIDLDNFSLSGKAKLKSTASSSPAPSMKQLQTGTVTASGSGVSGGTGTWSTSGTASAFAAPNYNLGYSAALLAGQQPQQQHQPPGGMGARMMSPGSGMGYVGMGQQGQQQQQPAMLGVGMGPQPVGMGAMGMGYGQFQQQPGGGTMGAGVAMGYGTGGAMRMQPSGPMMGYPGAYNPMGGMRPS